VQLRDRIVCVQDGLLLVHLADDEPGVDFINQIRS
jgi:hypothetical protein